MASADTTTTSDPPRTTGSDDAVDALREELASIESLPIADRVARFEHANSVLASALAELDEV